jgi:HSP20 family protein
MNLGSLIPWREKSRSPVTRDDIRDPFTEFRRDIERVFDQFFAGFPGNSFGLPALQSVRPNIDIEENSNEIIVAVELPGLDENDLDVTLSGDVLTIKGEKKAEREQKDGNSWYVERSFGTFSRSLRLPFTPTDEKIEAKYDKGVLTVRITKPSELQEPVRRIEVKSP